MDNGKELGVVNAYDSFKGFGFIRREKGKDVFFMYSEVISKELEPSIGDQVRFEVVKKAKGPRAFQIEILGTSF